MAEDKDEDGSGWHWRNSMKIVRFFRFDARAAILWIIVLVHMRYWTVSLAILMTVVFWMLERKGLSLPAALRAFRVWIIGPRRPALNWTEKRKFLDNGSS